MINFFSPPRILMFAPSCYPPGNPEAFVNANLVLAALEAGWEIDVISMAGMSHWYPSDNDSWARIATSVVSVAEHERTIPNQVSDALLGLIRSGHIVAGVRWALPAATEALRLVKCKKYDFIISRALPSVAHLAAFIVARKTGIPWIANWNDPTPWDKFPEPYEGGRGSAAPLGYWTSRYYRAVADRAAWHTFPCQRLRDYVTGYLPSDISERSSVVPHIALNMNSQSPTGNKVFTLMHAGSLRFPRSPETFIRGVRLFLDQVKPADGFSVVFVVDRPDEVLASARANGVEEVVQIEEGRPYSEMPAVLARADVLVIIEAPVAEGIFLPSKFVDYVRSGRPILAISPRVGTLADILTVHGGGIAVDGTNPEVISAALIELYNHWKLGNIDGKYSSSKLFSQFSQNTVLEKYKQIFSKLSENSRERRVIS